MRSPWVVALLVLSTALGAGACHPADRCGDGLVWNGASCWTCPAKSTWQNGTCLCDQAEYYSYVDGKCELNDGAMPPIDASADNDAGETGPGPTCADYCGFMTNCIGANELATGAVPDVVAGLHADDATSCTNTCEEAVGHDGSADPAVGCMANAASMCADLTGYDGLTASLAVIGDCCGTRRDNPLCTSICTTLKANTLVASMIDFCD